LHFDAVSQFRKSDDDHSGHRFGEEVARLRVALRLARQASSHAKANSVPYETGANFIQKLESDLQRATKDNDYIYNQPIPAETALAPIQNFPMAKVQHPEGLTQPKKALRGSTVPFGELMGWGANLAVGMYLLFSRQSPLRPRQIYTRIEKKI
jgi:programmed cell death 6-interacting protein